MNYDLKQKTGNDLLDLLQCVDDGYMLTEDELQFLRDIRVADFSDLDLSSLPESMSKLSNLTELNVSRNNLVSLPECIGTLSQLTKLNASNNSLVSLPKYIGTLSQLTKLDVSDNALKHLPEDIGTLSQLTELNVSYNSLTDLPESIYTLSVLQKLNISSNRIDSLSERLGELHCLTELDASNNHLENLPEGLFDLVLLTELNVSINSLEYLSERIGNLALLTELDVSINMLTDLPESLCELSHLTFLYASHNDLSSLPEKIGKLSQLLHISIYSNQLTSLPESIGRFFRITELDVSNNQLTSLPESIGELFQIVDLNVSDNQLTGLPESVGELPQLISLDISDNRLTSLPESIYQLLQLVELNVSGNQLTSFPERICEFTQLKELNVSRNQLTGLPERVSELSALTVLRLNGLKLQEVPCCIQQLSKLEVLELGDNPLKTLPDWLGDLSGLHTLNLSDLKLVEFPRSLLKLNLPFISNRVASFRENFDSSTSIFIDGTELSIQPISLFDQSRDRSYKFQQSRKLIEDYFNTEKVPIREAKVIFLGDGKVGKTYTIQRLLHSCRKGDYPTKETHGILIEDLCAEKNGESYKVRVWDFGGQDIMHEMHRCFLTDRTCYVVMVDTRTDKQTGRARYWLRTVQSIAPKAPVLLLVNEISGGQNRDLDYNGLKREFSNLVDVKYCSSMNASDEEFRQKVEHAIFQQALNLDSCKMELPESWENVRQNLLSLQNGADSPQKNVYYIDRHTFHRLCDRYSVPQDDGLRAWLLTWFNDLGVCFSYHLGEDGQEQSADYKILDPMWLTSAVYKIIWEKERTEDGLISLSEIYRILEKPGSDAMKKDGIPCLEHVSYNKKECGYVLDIMRMFCISYPADAYREFMPTLCKPDSNLDPIPQSWKQHAAYRFRYTFLPENVLHRLMIYCFANLRPGKRWRKGFWLECEAQGLSAVIRATGRGSEENELQVDVYAQTEQYEAWSWLQPLCQKIAEINHTLSLKAEVSILAENDRENTWIPLDDIWYWKSQGMPTMQGKRSVFPIQSLLSLIYGRYYPGVEERLMADSGKSLILTSQETFLQTVTAEVAELTGVNLSVPFEEQLGRIGKKFLEEMERSNALREREITALEQQTVAVKENTSVLSESTLTIQQSNELLQLLREGKVELPEALMEVLAAAFQHSGNPALQDAGQNIKRSSWKDKGKVLRELLGDAANLAAVGPVLAQLGTEYGPLLLNLLRTALGI